MDSPWVQPVGAALLVLLNSLCFWVCIKRTHMGIQPNSSHRNVLGQE
jgi:hypothetical protein